MSGTERKGRIEIYIGNDVTTFHNVPTRVAKALVTVLSEIENDESEVFSSVRDVRDVGDVDE